MANGQVIDLLIRRCLLTAGRCVLYQKNSSVLHHHQFSQPYINKQLNAGDFLILWKMVLTTPPISIGIFRCCRMQKKKTAGRSVAVL